MPALDPVSYWEKFKDYSETIWSNVTGAIKEQTTNPINSQMANLSGPVASVADGVKYGLIIAGVLLALFLIAEVKSITAAFKA